MKNKTWIFILGVCLLLFSCFQGYQNRKLKAERDVYKNNTSVLLSNIKNYKTKDSLNAVSAGNLELKLSEYKQFRESDMKVIESLNVDKKRLEKVTSSQTETIYALMGAVKDSIAFRDNYIIDTLKCIDIKDIWFNLTGCVDENFKFSGKFTSRDSLLYIEHIIPKKFWFIKWGVKERRQEIVSRNPHTIITGAEYITIRK